jgi:hypothetical protein
VRCDKHESIVGTKTHADKAADRFHDDFQPSVGRISQFCAPRVLPNLVLVRDYGALSSSG